MRLTQRTPWLPTSCILCKLVKITGTLFIEPRTKTQRFPRDFFEPEGEKSELRIECLFADADELAGRG